MLPTVFDRAANDTFFNYLFIRMLSHLLNRHCEGAFRVPIAISEEAIPYKCEIASTFLRRGLAMNCVKKQIIVSLF